MNDESYGLRFDIYERVHLSDELVGIDQLEEIELTPHIQVIPAGDQVTVRGSLLLVGAYTSAEDKRRSQSLEHWIPVEITLPLNRVSSLDDISVEVEYFDVDLLSTRTLNITGILSLHGITMERIEPSTWEPEQFTVVHQTDPKKEESEPAWVRDYEMHPSTFAAQAKEQAELMEYPEAEPTRKDNSVVFEEQQGQAPYPLNQTWNKSEPIDPVPIKEDLKFVEMEENKHDFEQIPLTWNNTHFNQFEAPEMVQMAPSVQQSADDSVDVQSEHETSNNIPEIAQMQAREAAYMNDRKLSHNDSKPTETVTNAHEHIKRDYSTSVEPNMTVPQTFVQAQATELADLGPEMKGAFNTPKRWEQPEEYRKNEEETIQRQVTSNETTASDEAKWQSLFLRRLDDNRAFKKVRLCIVQRQETLDTIADRYCMNSREIALYNRLSEMDVTEGQILYIPTSP